MPKPRETRSRSGVASQKKKRAELPFEKSLDFVLLAVNDRGGSGTCRLLGADREVALSTQGLRSAVPGEIVTVEPKKVRTYRGRTCLSGEITGVRLDVPALALVPLKLEDCGMWEPSEHYWGEEGEPLEEWAKPIFERGPRPEFELEQVVPGDEQDPNGPITDGPILEAIALNDRGHTSEARKVLMGLLAQDLRCLDAHAHLGNFHFGPESLVKTALKHYEVGVRIGELSLGQDFSGLLPWAWVDNRPFMRCLHGYGLCLWRLGRLSEARAVFDRMLWLNPTDNQGARFLLADMKAGKKWDSER
jgi:hypothetical protein